jgi:hypothetical protein
MVLRMPLTCNLVKYSPVQITVIKHASKLIFESVRRGGWTLGFPLYLSCLNGFQEVVLRMQDPSSGVPVRTVKTFMTKIPSVFTGNSYEFVLAKC